MSRILLPKSRLLGRRQFLGLGAAGLGAALLGGCDRLSEAPSFQEFLSSAEGLTYRMQRLLGGRRTLAREFSAADLSPDFKVNGTHAPDTSAYAALQETGFADWRLRVDGLVVRPLDLSLADLSAMPQRPRLPVTTASRAGARSANGRALRSLTYWRAPGSSQRRVSPCSIAPTFTNAPPMAQANIMKASI
jgi:DMSO/TMAO reductase YedYZ molybdopterin-dependent catalytic subunit